MLKEFKAFAMKGNLVDIAVAFVMGAAFNNVVTKFTTGIVSPIIGMIFDTDFNKMKYVLKEGVAESTNDAGVVTAAVAEVAVKYGEFLTATIDFIIVAFVMFMVVKGITNMKKKEEAAAPAPKGPSTEDLLSDIKDLLAKK